MTNAILSFFNGSAAIGARYFRGMVVASGLSLLLAFALMLWVSLGTLRDTYVSAAASMAEILAEKSRASVVFRDSNAALKGLEPLLHDPRVLGVAIVLPDNQVLAQVGLPFPQGEVLFQPNVREDASAERFSVRRIISSGEDNVGQVILDIELGSLRTHEQHIVGAFVAAFLFSGLLAIALARRTVRTVAAPMAELAKFAGQVGNSGDYNLRTKAEGPLEVATLGRALNELLGRIESQNEELLAQKLRVESADRVKSLFLANMSHEIRTPINGVLGATRLLEESQLSEEQRDLADVLKAASAGLLRVVNDILDFSKIEAGRINITPAPSSLWEIIRLVIAPWKHSADQKCIRITTSMDERLPPLLEIDANRCSQILMHLVGNAIKFSSEGGTVHVHASLIAPKRFRIDVVDSGIGIPKEKLGEVFLPFVQADSSFSRRYGGTGLGLSIAHRLVELLGGSLFVESEVGRGSTFSVELPFAEAKENCLAPPGGRREAKRAEHNGESWAPLLLVEDTPLNQKLTAALLRKRGFSVVIAENGQKALELLAVQKFSLVFMDCQMPGMDGLTATRILRGSSLPAKDIPIVALTAHAMCGDREECLAAGMDDYLSKPLDTEELQRVLDRFLAQPSSPRTTPDL